jgi:acetoin utilization deacetylase AcuC-like enzyme
VLFAADESFARHDEGRDHPESPGRLKAVARGALDAGLAEALLTFSPRRASREELARVHDLDYVAALEEFCLSGGGHLDQDTSVVEASYEAALHAAGAGPDAIARLRAGEADAAFLAVRPPGHHARRASAMGFCLLNNAAVAVASLIDSGERVLVLDWDAHHGNGTQEMFYEEPEALVISMHQHPFYPGTGSLAETGSGAGAGQTINMPFPAGTAGDAYRFALEEVVVPAAEYFAPTWLVVSAGFDAHRADPLTDLGLSASDFADLTQRAVELVAPGRRLFFLEGGYDLEALAKSAGATLAALVGTSYRPEPATGGAGAAGGPTVAAIAVARAASELHERLVRAQG